MRLGGWQRLWVVASAIWLIPVAWFTIASMSADDYELRRCQATEKLIEKEATLNVKMPDGTTIINVPEWITQTELARLYGKPLTQSMPNSTFQMEFRELLRRGGKQSAEEILGLYECSEKSVRRLQEQYGKWIDFSEVEQKYVKDSSKNFKIALVGLGSWLASIVIVYLFGWAIGWVIKGFKSRGET